MINIEELQCRVKELLSDKARMAGTMSAICRCLDEARVPKVSNIHKRVNLLAISYDQMRLENKRLKLMLDDRKYDDA